MKQIELVGKKGSGKFALVDDEDFDKLNVFKWNLMATTHTSYAKRAISHTQNIYLHREIMGCVKGDGKIIDHIDGNGLNCQKSNLRFCTNQQNISNKKHVGPGFKGVQKIVNSLKKPYQAKITVNYKNKYLGAFENEIDAAKAYDEAAIRYFGEFAKLNFPTASCPLTK